MTGHGRYPRRVLLPASVVPVWIERWLCTNCDATTSLLPDCVHRYRHYAMVVLSDVVQVRLVDQATWRSVERACSVQGAPSGRSMRRWCNALAVHAHRWLEALLRVIAQAMPEAAELDPHPKAEPVARTVLRLSLRLGRWLAAVRPSTDALRVMWCWGWNAGIGRLI